METTLNSQRLNEIFMDCLFKEGEPTEPNIQVEGVVSNFGLHPQRLEGYKSEITAMLAELPATFHQNTGGGWSFLNARMDKHGNQWTGEYRSMEQLFVLGIAIGKAQCPLPRNLWSSLPGGMPYYVVLA